MRIVCLVPARNAEEDLPALLDSTRHFADAVVALDDGSTDGTRAILESHPLVGALLSNPRRSGYEGWNDSENRNRLLQAAADLDPTWIVSLDADERMDPEDGRALRGFLAGDALPGLAYGLQHFRMWGEDRYDPRPTWIFRVFAFEPGQEFPPGPLHFDPIPTSITTDRWVRTTIRVRHVGAATEERRLARLEKYRAADPDAVYRTDFGGLADVIEDDLPVWPSRPAALPVIASDPDPLISVAPETARNQTLAVLLPVRNAGADLPGWLSSVRGFADAVVALDDGSTDDTATILESDPLVRVLLRNSRREGYEGWDDAGNRERLLHAAASQNPGWVLFLDADEALDDADAQALRRFVDEEARPGFAYGFRVYRMLDGRSYDRAGLWVYRLFAFEPDARLPARRLHFVPVPVGIPRDRWLRTTIRIRHFGASTQDKRRERVAKYRAADPAEEFQTDYQTLAEQSLEPVRWEDRPDDLPVLLDRPDGGRPVSMEVPDLGALDGPVLSAIVISRDDEDRIERALRSVVSQECPFEFEVIAVVSGTDRTADIVREKFPEVRLVELPRPALPGEARNAGLRVARGDYVSFPGSHIELPSGSLAARVRAHELGYPMVTGVFENGTRTRAGWANYFLDHSINLPTAPPAELRGPPAHCSYDRDFLLSVGAFPEDMRAGEDTAVNVALWRRGLVAFRSNEVRLVHNSPCVTPGRLLRHHFGRGRALGRLMLERWEGRPAAALRTMRNLVAYVPTRVRRTTVNIDRYGDADTRARYRDVRVLVVAASVSAWLGAWTEIVTRAVTGPRRRRRRVDSSR